MAQLTLFPLQYLRQDAVPLDVDQTFLTTASRIQYLTSPRRYAGQIVADLELNKLFFLSADKSEWLLIGDFEIDDSIISSGSTWSSQKIVNFVESKSYRHTQTVASTTWTVPHNFGEECTTQIFVDGKQVFTTVEHSIDKNSVILTFSKPQVGSVLCTI